MNFSISKKGQIRRNVPSLMHNFFFSSVKYSKLLQPQTNQQEGNNAVNGLSIVLSLSLLCLMEISK